MSITGTAINDDDDDGDDDGDGYDEDPLSTWLAVAHLRRAQDTARGRRQRRSLSSSSSSSSASAAAAASESLSAVATATATAAVAGESLIDLIANVQGGVATTAAAAAAAAAADKEFSNSSRKDAAVEGLGRRIAAAVNAKSESNYADVADKAPQPKPAKSDDEAASVELGDGGAGETFKINNVLNRNQSNNDKEIRIVENDDDDDDGDGDGDDADADADVDDESTKGATSRKVLREEVSAPDCGDYDDADTPHNDDDDDDDDDNAASLSAALAVAVVKEEEMAMAMAMEMKVKTLAVTESEVEIALRAEPCGANAAQDGAAAAVNETIDKSAEDRARQWPHSADPSAVGATQVALGGEVEMEMEMLRRAPTVPPKILAKRFAAQAAAGRGPVIIKEGKTIGAGGGDGGAAATGGGWVAGDANDADGRRWAQHEDIKREQEKETMEKIADNDYGYDSATATDTDTDTDTATAAIAEGNHGRAGDGGDGGPVLAAANGAQINRHNAADSAGGSDDDGDGDGDGDGPDGGVNETENDNNNENDLADSYDGVNATTTRTATTTTTTTAATTPAEDAARTAAAIKVDKFKLNGRQESGAAVAVAVAVASARPEADVDGDGNGAAHMAAADDDGDGDGDDDAGSARQKLTSARQTTAPVMNGLATTLSARAADSWDELMLNDGLMPLNGGASDAFESERGDEEMDATAAPANYAQHLDDIDIVKLEDTHSSEDELYKTIVDQSALKPSAVANVSVAQRRPTAAPPAPRKEENETIKSGAYGAGRTLDAGVYPLKPLVTETIDSPGKRILINLTIGTDDSSGSVYTLHVAVPIGDPAGLHNGSQNLEQILTHERHAPPPPPSHYEEAAVASPYCVPEPPPPIPECPCSCAAFGSDSGVDADVDDDSSDIATSSTAPSTTIATIIHDDDDDNGDDDADDDDGDHDDDDDGASALTSVTLSAGHAASDTASTTNQLDASASSNSPHGERFACPDVMPILILEGD